MHVRRVAVRLQRYDDSGVISTPDDAFASSGPVSRPQLISAGHFHLLVFSNGLACFVVHLTPTVCFFGFPDAQLTNPKHACQKKREEQNINPHRHSSLWLIFERYSIVERCPRMLDTFATIIFRYDVFSPQSAIPFMNVQC